jgi:hypothetical protein
VRLCAAAAGAASNWTVTFDGTSYGIHQDHARGGTVATPTFTPTPTPTPTPNVPRPLEEDLTPRHARTTDDPP